MSRGKFHGIICPATPIGSCRVCIWYFPSAGTVKPWILSAHPAQFGEKFVSEIDSKNDKGKQIIWLQCSHQHSSEIDEPTLVIRHARPVHKASHYSMSQELQVLHYVSQPNQQSVIVSVIFPEKNQKTSLSGKANQYLDIYTSLIPIIG